MSREPYTASWGNVPAGVRPRPKQGRSRLAATPRVEMLEERVCLTTLPAGFTITPVVSGLNGGTAMEIAPDGRLFVLEQSGNVKLVRNNGTTWTALHLNLDFNGERGLLGIAFDPKFTSNHFVYLYYTNPNPGGAAWASGEHNQLSRFTVLDSNPQQPTFVNEAPILDWNNLSGATNHNGGAIHFGLDGMLYADAGDNAQVFTQGGISYRVSQTLTNLLGKQLRIDVSQFNSGFATRDDTTVGHLIPSDNPFVGRATGINQLIYVLGLRNPFTFAVQPGTGKIFINDVGENTWEEINQSVAGANYGWSGRNTDGFGQSPPGPGMYHEPLLAYNHSGGPAGGGDAIVGGTFYNPASPQFPSSYVGKYFYEDLTHGWIRVFDPAHPGSAGNPDTSTAFASGLGGLRDLKVDSAGNLYYLGGDGSLVNKISYQVPQITKQPAGQAVTRGQTATFHVTATGPGLIYQWQHLVGTTWKNVGTNAPTLIINNAATSDAGSYRVIVHNTFGSVTSQTATLTVLLPHSAPSIVTQPINRSVRLGGSVTFTVVAGGTAPLVYQWQHLIGSTWHNVGVDSPNFTINPAKTSSAGNYRVLVTNLYGRATSRTVFLTVVALRRGVHE
jgi:glucose/arabinose dehydrogenase